MSKKICPKCKNKCESDDMFCMNCGAKLSPVAVAEHHSIPTETKSIEKKICPKCHNKIEAGDLFCMNCGYKVDSVTDVKPEIVSPDLTSKPEARESTEASGTLKIKLTEGINNEPLSPDIEQYFRNPGDLN